MPYPYAVRRQLAADLYESGRPVSVIAKRMAISEKAVHELLRFAGLVGRPEPIDREIERLALEGHGAAEISRHLSIQYRRTVRRLATIAGYREREVEGS